MNLFRFCQFVSLEMSDRKPRYRWKKFGPEISRKPFKKRWKRSNPLDAENQEVRVLRNRKIARVVEQNEVSRPRTNWAVAALEEMSRRQQLPCTEEESNPLDATDISPPPPKYIRLQNVAAPFDPKTPTKDILSPYEIPQSVT